MPWDRPDSAIQSHGMQVALCKASHYRVRGRSRTMAHVTDHPKYSLSEVLEGRGIGRRTFARMLAGPDASKEAIDSKRRQIKEWLEKDRWNDATAESFSAALKLPADYFKRPRQPRPRQPTVAELASRLALAEDAIVHLRQWVRIGFEAVGLAPELEDEARPAPTSPAPPAPRRRKASQDGTSP